MSDIPEEKIEKVIEQMREDNIKFIRLQFVDINGTVKTIVIPFTGEDMSELFNDGMLFDGSSIAGFVGINESDLVLKPDIDTYSRLSWRPEESATCSRFRHRSQRAPARTRSPPRAARRGCRWPLRSWRYTRSARTRPYCRTGFPPPRGSSLRRR